MGKHYSQFTLEERCEVARLLTAGASQRQIATALGRAPSSITREVNRNGSPTAGYDAKLADDKAWARRWGGSMLERDDVLRDVVLGYLGAGWSPEQVSGHLARETRAPVISHETIYRFIYGQIARTKDYAWRHYLPRAQSKRGRRGRRGGSPASFIAQRRPLAERPQAAADRQTPGHWEVDLMLFRTYGQAVLTVHERHSRLLLATRPPGKAADPIAAALHELFATLPAAARQTATFDNGTEFADFVAVARHYRLHDLGMQTFFCDTHSPWQKGGIENAIGRLRRLLPAQNRPGHGERRALRPVGASVQPRPAQVLGVPNTSRSIHQPSVALEM